MLAGDDGLLDEAQIRRIADQVVALEDRGLRVVIVSSGAIAAGIGELDLDGRPDALPQLQACASVGQSKLMRMFDEALRPHGRHAAQILLVRDDVEDRTRYLNIRNCIAALQQYGAVPVVNENDTVSVDEIRFGDNDTLSALVASFSGADLLVMLTDVAGLLDENGEVVQRRPVCTARPAHPEVSVSSGAPRSYRRGSGNSKGALTGASRRRPSFVACPLQLPTARHSRVSASPPGGGTPRTSAGAWSPVRSPPSPSPGA